MNILAINVTFYQSLTLLSSNIFYFRFRITITVMDNTESITLKDTLLPRVEAIVSRDVTQSEKLFAICELLADEVEHFDWVGFYIADKEIPNQLVLGPFVGPPTNHTTIPYGKGICGQVALSHSTYVSQDVHAEENYLSCSPSVQSEIVVPILKNGNFVAQIDIDSNTKHSISDAKKELLEEICTLLSNEF